MYFVYFLECKDGSLYTGITNDIDKRMAKHLAGSASKYTRAKGPTKIIYTEQYETRGEALKREAEIKKWRRKKKLDLINNKLPRI